MQKLKTPFGKIELLTDGKSAPYTAQKCGINKTYWPHVKDVYRITVLFKPDGREHSISCVLSPSCAFRKDVTPGERLECLSFYNDGGFMMCIGAECEGGYDPNGNRLESDYDYDASYLKNGLEYGILPGTKTEKYVFGIAWADGISFDSDGDTNDNELACETWVAADPSIALKNKDLH